MLKEEADWIRQEVSQLLKSGKVLYPMANIGSSDGYNTGDQPWIRSLIDFIKGKGEFKNIDIKTGDEIDISGDLLDPRFITELRQRGFKSYLCANILTNIRDTELFIDALLKLANTGDYLILTVSHQYPYMADPVDNLFRPSPDELAVLFKNTKIIESCLVSSESYLQILMRRKKLLFITLLRLLTPFYKFKTWINLIKYIPQIRKPVSASCVILEKL